MCPICAECFNPYVCVMIGIVVLVLVIIYYVYLVRAILQMLVRDTSTVLLTFSFLSLLPTPPTGILGILVLIIWRRHRGVCQVTRS